TQTTPRASWSRSDPAKQTLRGRDHVRESPSGARGRAPSKSSILVTIRPFTRSAITLHQENLETALGFCVIELCLFPGNSFSLPSALMLVLVGSGVSVWK